MQPSSAIPAFLCNLLTCWSDRPYNIQITNNLEEHHWLQTCQNNTPVLLPSTFYDQANFESNLPGHHVM